MTNINGLSWLKSIETERVPGSICATRKRVTFTHEGEDFTWHVKESDKRFQGIKDLPMNFIVWLNARIIKDTNILTHVRMVWMA